VETKEQAKEISEISSSDSHKPLMLVDIDGVISLFGGDLTAQTGSFHSIEGIPHFLSSTAAGHLLELTEHLKLDAIDAFAKERALAWIDDALNAACHDWARARAAPTLLVQTQPEQGLTSRELQLLLAWARELAPS
jgi:hypothetical protein